MNGPNLEAILKANPNAPTNDQFAKEFASQLFIPIEQRMEEPLELELSEGVVRIAARDHELIESCGESTMGMMDAVLASDLISDAAKADIRSMVSDSMPTFEQEKAIGHFHFMWTESSSDHRDNTNEENIDATAVFLNECYDLFATNFRPPKAALISGQRIIDVECYYNPRLHGSTSSHTNTIYLNSHTVINDDCRRQTVSAHELFHRVEYAYGYVTGTAGQRWWIEAMASWSQDYSYADVNDYVLRMNSGLTTSQNPLLNRSYDACHFWKYVGEQVRKRTNPAVTDERTLHEILSKYAVNGFDLQSACEVVIHTYLGRSFDRFFQDWSKANYIKNLDNPSVKYAYDEDRLVTNSCGRSYGPYARILPAADVDVADSDFTWHSGQRFVEAYGTDYLLFRLGTSVDQFSLRFEANPEGGDGMFAAHLILLNDNRWKRIYNSPLAAEQTWNQEFEAGTYDSCVLVVNGLAKGGTYEVSLNSCISGVWRDNYNYIWTLVQSGDDISGSVKTTSCGTYSVGGTFDGEAITLNASGTCCDFSYQGSIDDCAAGGGAWTNTCGGTGEWSLTRIVADAARGLVDSEVEEIADDPATLRP